jgi:hypothetical protein
MHRALPAVLVAAIAATTARGAVHLPNLPATFRSQLATLHAKHVGPILLPETFLGYRKHYHPSLRRTTHGYELDLATSPGCHSSYSLCFIASFSARHGAPRGIETLPLAGGITGHYRSQKCSETTGTCRAPTLEFVYGGLTYSIAAEIARTPTERPDFTRMANSAIVHGPR